jgi:hypothetical protein
MLQIETFDEFILAATPAIKIVNEQDTHTEFRG